MFEALVHAGREVPLVKLLLVPDAWSNKTEMPEAHRALFAYCNCVMEPWDGPAALAVTDGRWILAGMDRAGLRPMRYTVTAAGLLLVGSETGMVPVDETTVVEKGRLGPGEMVAVDFEAGRLYHDRELKDGLAAGQPYGEWIENITELDSLIRADGPAPTTFPVDELRRRERLFGWSLEDLELILRRWSKTPRSRSAPWATTRRWRCSPTTIGACTTSSARTSARSPTRRSTVCASAG